MSKALVLSLSKQLVNPILATLLLVFFPLELIFIPVIIVLVFTYRGSKKHAAFWKAHGLAKGIAMRASIIIFLVTLVLMKTNPSLARKIELPRTGSFTFKELNELGVMQFWNEEDIPDISIELSEKRPTVKKVMDTIDQVPDIESYLMWSGTGGNLWNGGGHAFSRIKIRRGPVNEGYY